MLGLLGMIWAYRRLLSYFLIELAPDRLKLLLKNCHDGTARLRDGHREIKVLIPETSWAIPVPCWAI